MTTALRTDRYEFSMLSSVLASGAGDSPAVFEMFARRLPAGRRFGLLAGTGRFLEALTDFRFDPDTINWLRSAQIITDDAARYLNDWRFTGDILGYREGDLYWPGSPVLTVRGRLADGFLLETLALSIFNHDTAVASAAARMVLAAGGRPIIEMGSRRVDPDAAVAGARAAYIAGFAATSNLEAGRRYAIPTAGTAAHAFTLAHHDEVDAFASQIATWGVATTLLVDTFDIETGIAHAVQAAANAGANGPGAIRIDSGDLAYEASKARAQLDALGATGTRIVVSSDLDEYAMTELAPAPIDTYGAGTRVSTGSGHPSAGFVYKLVEIDGRPVEKKATGKASAGGEKTAYRYADGSERYTVHNPIPEGATGLQEVYVKSGIALTAGDATARTARIRAEHSLASLSDAARQVADGTAYRTCIQEQP